MHIFVDEAGPFEVGAPNARYSCVGALFVPSADLQEITYALDYLKTATGISGELKGGQVDEVQAASLVGILSHFDVVFEVAVFCSRTQTLPALLEHRRLSAAGVTMNMTPEHHPDLVAQAHVLANAIESMHPKLFSQVCMTVELLARGINRANLYYVQRVPGELGRFAWEFDPKDSARARKQFGSYDEILRAIIAPWLQSKSGRVPMIHLIGADYSAFEAFEDEYPTWPKYLEPLGVPKPVKKDGPYRVVSINKLFAERSFPPSHTSPGLQIVDALTSIVKRVINGSLHPFVLDSLPKLMVKAQKGHHVIPILNFGPGHDEVLRDELFSQLIRHCDRNAKAMLMPD